MVNSLALMDANHMLKSNTNWMWGWLASEVVAIDRKKTLCPRPINCLLYTDRMDAQPGFLYAIYDKPRHKPCFATNVSDCLLISSLYDNPSQWRNTTVLIAVLKSKWIPVFVDDDCAVCDLHFCKIFCSFLPYFLYLRLLLLNTYIQIYYKSSIYIVNERVAHYSCSSSSSFS